MTRIHQRRTAAARSQQEPVPSAQQDRLPIGKKEKRRSNGRTLLLLMLALIGFLSFQRLHVSPWNGNDNALVLGD